MPDTTWANCYTLSCDELRLSIEFAMSRGEFGRIGSSQEMEISLPLVGLSEEECRIYLDEAGILWLLREGRDLPVRLDPPSYFRTGPYKFLIREKVEHLAPSNPAPTTKLQATPPETTRERRRFPKRSSKTGKIAAAVLGLVFLGATVWLANRIASKNSEDGKRVLAASPPVPEKTESSRPDATTTVSKEETEKHPKPSEATEIAAPPAPQVAEKPAPKSPPEHERLDLEQLASTVAPCVFLIQVMDAIGNMYSTGTGFAVSADGLVATNHHVIEHGHTFSLMTGQGAKFDQARIVATDPDADLAILKIDAKGLPFLTLAITSNVPVGKRVAVYGSPKGLAGTLSEGIISASSRNLSENLPEETFPNRGVLIQTTAPVSPGSSGSPLFDAEGKVIGVMTLSGPRNSQNLNFAVPVEALKALIGRASSGWSSFGAKPEAPRTAASPKSLGPDTKFFADPGYRGLQEKMNARDWVESLKIARQLTEKHQKSPMAHFQHAYCAAMLRLDHQAEVSFLKAIELEPDNHLAWNNLGVAFRSQEQPQKALVAFEKSVALKPDNSQAWDSIVVTSVIVGNWAKAATALDTLAQLDLGMAKERAKMLSGLSFPDAGVNLAVRKTLLRKVGNLAPNGSLKFKVVGVSPSDPLSVRSGPGVNYDKVISIANGTEVFVVSGGKMNGTTEWLPIEFGNSSGWVASKFLQAME